MTLRNALGGLVLDATAQASNALLTAIRDRLAGVLDVRVTNQAGSVVEPRLVPEPGRLLIANEVWTSPWVPVSQFSTASVLANTDVASAVGGASLQFSIDGVALEQDKTVASTIPPGGGAFSFPPQAEYMRFQYTNGAAAQTRFRTEVILHYTAPGLVQQPIGAPITDANSAAVVRNANMVRLATGQWTAQTQPLTDAQLGARLPLPVDLSDTHLATEATVGTLGTEGTLASRASETTLASRASEASLLEVRDRLPLLGVASEATLAGLVPLLDGLEGVLGQIRTEQLTDQQLRAAALTMNPDRTASGTLAIAGDTVEVTPGPAHSAWAVQLGSGFSAGSQVAFEGTTDGTTWFPLNGRLNGPPAANAISNVLTAIPAGPGPAHYRGNDAAVWRFRVRAVTVAVGDTITVAIRTGSGLGATFLNAPLPSGSNFIGYTGEEEAEASRMGLFRWSGGKATTDVTKPNASVTVSNPSTTHDLILTRYMIEVDASADIVIIHGATSTGAVRKNTNPNQRTTGTNPMECRVGAGVLSGGEVQDYVRRSGTQSPVSVGPFRHRIPPAKTWTARFLGPGASNTVWFTVGGFAVLAGGDLL